MQKNDEKYCDRMEDAFLRACDIFEHSTVNVLMYHLEETYHIRFKPPCSTLEDIEAALFDITGTGAGLIIKRMEKFLD
ncbi:hypothetical protein [Nitrososphaera viennensis]|mgnify:FL=1|uniref:Uncharacterized protein n=1 Tax=Nitrososphaera viennensis TaxID=1034015 RepID=A0A977IFS7_9ARCH|nr:hypothetical protein [Nitrososphaera viennensis]UVS69941.1 hypothetical protein NWT39_03925 [Nitrososphaera viennensis]